MLAQKYCDGVGVDQSYQQARELTESLRVRVRPGAQYNLGCFYGKGQGSDTKNWDEKTSGNGTNNK